MNGEVLPTVARKLRPVCSFPISALAVCCMLTTTISSGVAAGFTGMRRGSIAPSLPPLTPLTCAVGRADSMADRPALKTDSSGETPRRVSADRTDPKDSAPLKAVRNLRLFLRAS